MSFLEFQKTFNTFPIISIVEIRKHFPSYDVNALSRWQRKGYIEKIRNGYYRLNLATIGKEAELGFIANRIYLPSYVSLESALKWYGFIPEEVFTITSVSTRKTHTFDTNVGRFSYRTIKPSLFFGYCMKSFGSAYYYKMASPEKALLDYLYFYPTIKEEADFFEWRLNAFEIKEVLNLTTLEDYLTLFSSKALDKRLNKLLQFLKLC